MTITPLRKVALAGAALVALAASSNQVSAAPSFSIRIGTPPPPVVVEHPWARPAPSAIWIDGHHEWIRGRWVWVSGYYTYPPKPGGYWVPARYANGYYYSGHWAYHRR